MAELLGLLLSAACGVIATVTVYQIRDLRREMAEYAAEEAAYQERQKRRLARKDNHETAGA